MLISSQFAVHICKDSCPALCASGHVRDICLRPNWPMKEHVSVFLRWDVCVLLGLDRPTEPRPNSIGRTFNSQAMVLKFQTGPNHRGRQPSASRVVARTLDSAGRFPTKSIVWRRMPGCAGHDESHITSYQVEIEKDSLESSHTKYDVMPFWSTVPVVWNFRNHFSKAETY